MKHYNFTGPVFAKPARRVRSPRAVMFVVGSVESRTEDGVVELGYLGADGYFVARASFLPSVTKEQREEFLYFVP